MVKILRIIGAIITAIGGIMFVRSGFPDFDTFNLGRLSDEAPFAFFIITFLSLLPVVFGLTVVIVGISSAGANDKKSSIGVLIFSIVILIGGFIPLTLYDIPTFFLFGSKLFHITINESMWINIDAIIMIIGATIIIMGVYIGHYKI